MHITEKLRWTVLILIIISILSGQVFAEKKKLAILPFETYSSEDINQLKKAISSMLRTRIMEKGGFDVLEAGRVDEIIGESGKTGWDEKVAREAGKRLGVDFVIWGSISRFGRAVSIDINLLSVNTEEIKRAFSEQGRGEEAVVDIASSLSEKIVSGIQEKEPPAFQSQRKPFSQPFTKEEKKGSSFRKVKEPSEGEIYSSYPIERSAYLLCIADVDAEGREEIVLAEEKGISVYTPSGRRLIPVYTYSFPDKELKPIALTCSDENGNGFPEIYISAGKEVVYMDRKDTLVYSYILEIKEGKLYLVAKDLPFYIRAMDGENGKSLLIGQEKGDWEPYQGSIFNLKWVDGRLKRERLPSLRNMARLYGFLLHPDESDLVILVDEEGTIGVFELSTERMITRYDGNLGKYDRLSFQQKLREEKYVYGFHTKQTSYPVYVQRRMIYKKEYSDQFFTIDAKHKKVTLLGASGEDSIIGFQFKDGRITETYRSKTIPRYILDFAFGDLTGKGKEDLWVLTRDDEGRYFMELIAD